jgi:hypothetical protein
VKDGRVTIDGETHQLSLNDFGTGLRHHVHGGRQSFDRLLHLRLLLFLLLYRRNWETALTPEGDGVVFSLLSLHGEEVFIVQCLANKQTALKFD